MILWNAHKTYCWHRGFAFAVDYEQSRLKYYARYCGSSDSLAVGSPFCLGGRSLKSDNVTAVIRGLTPHLFSEVPPDIDAIDQVPGELHQISSKRARLAATTAFLRNTEISARVRRHTKKIVWPPFDTVLTTDTTGTDVEAVTLRFPDGDYLNYQIVDVKRVPTSS